MSCACGTPFSISVTTRASARRSPASSRSTISALGMLGRRLFRLGSILGRCARRLDGGALMRERLEVVLHARGIDVLAHVVDDGGERRAWPKVALDAHRLDGWEVLVGQDAAGHHQHVIDAILAQQLHYFGE